MPKSRVQNVKRTIRQKRVAKLTRGYDVKSWIFLPQHGNGFSIVNSDSLETIWKQWSTWRELSEFTIEPCADLDQTVALYC